MSLRTTPCDPAAESLTDLAFANEYLSRHPESAAWAEANEGAAGEDRCEALLAAASRMVGRAPLSAPALGTVFGWPAAAFPIPIVGHTVETIRPDDWDGATATGTALVGRDGADWIGGAVRIGASFYSVVEFDADAGALTLESTPAGAEAGAAFTLVTRVPRSVREAVCEQAAHLLAAPNSGALDAAAAGITQWSVSGPGAGGFSVGAPSATAELCFAARRLLRQAGILRYGNPRAERA